MTDHVDDREQGSEHTEPTEGRFSQAELEQLIDEFVPEPSSKNLKNFTAFTHDKGKLC